MSNGTIEPASQPTIERPTSPQINAPAQPVAPADRAAQRGGSPVPSGRRPSSDRDRPRTAVTRMEVNIDARRVALGTADGPPYRGDIDTDLAPGVYALTPDRRQHLWIFEPRQVKSGLRFDLVIDGPDPFTLNYAQPLLLVVTGGLESAGFDTLGTALRVIDMAVHDKTPDRWADALDYLCELTLVDLYDLLDELEASHPGVAGEVLLHFSEAQRLSDAPGQDGVLRALESFVRKPSEYFVDAFNTWQVNPASFKADPERARAGLTNIQLILTYDATPPIRALTVYADEISDDTAVDPAPPTYGPLSLTYPQRLSLGSTPRLHAAKKAAIAQIETQNAEFIASSFKLVAGVLLSVYQASMSLAKIDAASQARGYQPRAERGPGQWRPTFEGGSNMSEEAAAFENSSCGTPRGMGYYVDNVQFEGFRNGKLLDAKLWKANGFMGKAMTSRPNLAESIILRSVRRQIPVAQKYGVGIQWRVGDSKVAEMLQTFMQDKGLAVDIVYISPK